MVVDTDVFIWLFRGNQKAASFLNNLDNIFISDVTYMELMQGAKNKREAHFIDKSLEDFVVTRIAINESISKNSCDLVRRYFLSHSMQLGDALIASTALACNLELSSGNFKHFSFIENLKLIPFVPK